MQKESGKCGRQPVEFQTEKWTRVVYTSKNRGRRQKDPESETDTDYT